MDSRLLHAGEVDGDFIGGVGVLDAKSRGDFKRGPAFVEFRGLAVEVLQGGGEEGVNLVLHAAHMEEGILQGRGAGV